MCFMFGLDFGATFLGVLFHMIGTRNTLMAYSGMTAVMLILFLVYIKYSKRVEEYEKLPAESGDDCNADGVDVKNDVNGGKSDVNGGHDRIDDGKVDSDGYGEHVGNDDGNGTHDGNDDSKGDGNDGGYNGDKHETNPNP